MLLLIPFLESIIIRLVFYFGEHLLFEKSATNIDKIEHMLWYLHVFKTKDGVFVAEPKFSGMPPLWFGGGTL